MAQTGPNLTTESDSTLLRHKPKSTDSQGITSHRAGIAWSWFLVTVPISALTAVFLALVFHYRLHHGDSPFPNLRLPSAEDEKNVFYVNLSSSVILFSTSWASSVAPMLSSFVLVLASFPIARRLSRDIQRGRADRLPTPYQLCLTLKFIDGSLLGAMWDWFCYFLPWNKGGERQTPPLRAASTVAVLATLLGLLVTAADTWLHFATTTVPFTRVSPITNHTDYSFGLLPQCLKGNNSVAAQRVDPMGPVCSVSLAVTGSFLADATTSLQVMNNVSDQATVYTYADEHKTSYTYLGVPESASLLTRDFTAKTYGARTQCELISTKCGLQNVASSVKFNCSAEFAGFIKSPTLQAAFFEDETMSKNLRGKVVSNYGTGNPYYFALASMVNLSGGKTPNSTEFVQSLHGVPTYVLGCNTTIYDIEYDRLNNTVTRFQPTVSNTSVSNIWQTSISQTQDWFPFFQQAVGTAIFSDTAQEFAEKVALALSKATIALGADALGAQPALAAQERETLLVARIPAAPLVTMVVVCLLYVVCGLLLTGLAAWSARNGVPDVQARLSIAGLVADRFEEPGLRSDTDSVEKMFAEYSGKESKRIAIESVDRVGVYRYTTWQKPEGSTSDW
ncbi:hypothetical protein IFM58399_06146 [Aspergillus lentulus]|uniref:Uncharacterized protein n=1 Tax=Aspergillus lentulus TaxID=293939 RepID=A0ABQ1AL37_ASPLE|nr:uncharacterized protein IFM58399_06146 [Aspergillus lentulus]GFF41089.1 hypothetical protein IFM58399_06146 [Aspergillus lentulus]GFF83870.1 hypothetical protein IFM60648_06841 [Aspergillus lentulus]